MHTYRYTTLLVVALTSLLHPVLATANEKTISAAALSISIDHSDGGRQSDRQMRKLLEALQQHGCNARVEEPLNKAPAQLHFDPTPVNRSALWDTDYRLVARAITLEGKSSMRGAILVHASTGISELASLKGQRIAFVSKGSATGYQEPLKLLSDAGINESWDTYFYAGNHVGAISALLHSDTDVAVAAEPLAQRWAKYNELSVVAVSEEVETGGWWAHQSLPMESIGACVRALETLDRSQMKALPAWIGRFKSVIPSG